MASFSVVSGVAAANAQANLARSNASLNQALERLSSGFRINHSGDDPARLAVANSYRNSQAIVSQGIRNINDGLSKLQIKDSALSNIATILDRMATLATTAASTATTGAGAIDITKLSSEFSALTTEIDREASVASVATTASFSIFISSETTVGNGAISGSIGGVTAALLGVTTTTFTTAGQAQTVLALVQTAITNLGSVQNAVGTLQNRLQLALAPATSFVLNTKTAESRIRDANIAEEAANMTRYNVLTQSGIAALAQANQVSASVLALLRF